MNEAKISQYVRVGAVAVASISLVILLVLIALQAYVRWTINQNFTFLGGSELEALTLSAFLLTLGLAWMHRSSS